METVLINDLLDVSPSGQGKLQLNLNLVDLREVLGKSVPAFQDEITRKNIRLNLRLETARTFVMGASSRLHQILNNLMTNAVKFTPENGEITVELREEKGRIQLSVSDTGCGIEASTIEKIFDPLGQFDRKADNAHGGLGLGLTIARKLAELHGGRLTATSAGLGRGATFTLELPLADAESAELQRPTRAARQQSGDQSKPEILLIDDHADTLRTLAFLLRRSGYQVATAQTVGEAEPLLGPKRVLVSDIGLPDGNGWDLMARFKAQGGRPGIAIEALDPVSG